MCVWLVACPSASSPAAALPLCCHVTPHRPQLPRRIAQAAVLASIPVVFFTAKGIPGEVEERMDTPAGLVAASMRAMGLGGRLGRRRRPWQHARSPHRKTYMHAQGAQAHHQACSSAQLPIAGGWAAAARYRCVLASLDWHL